MKTNNLLLPFLVGLISLITFFSPILGLISVLSFLKMNKYKSYCILSFFISLGSLFQTARLIDRPYRYTDWEVGYTNMYNVIGNSNIFNFLTDGEPVWFLLNHLSYNLLNISPIFFLKVISIITIILLCITIHNFWKARSKNLLELICAFCLLILSYEFYSYLNNIIRIIFAFSIGIYAYAKFYTHSKSPIPLLIIATLIHNLAGILLVIGFFRKVFFQYRLFTGSIILTFIFSLMVFFQTLISNQFLNINNIPILTDILQRFATIDNPNDKNLYNIDNYHIIFLSFSAITFLYFERIQFIFKKSYNPFNIILIYLMIMVIFSIFVFKELAIRLYSIKFMFFPFVIPFLKFKILNLKNKFIVLIILIFSISFLLNFNNIYEGSLFPKLNQLILINNSIFKIF